VFENRVLRRIFGHKREEVGENCRMRNFIICIMTWYYYDDQIKDGDMGGTCKVHGKDEKYIQNFSQKT
jgi:hypothetical protein